MSRALAGLGRTLAGAPIPHRLARRAALIVLLSLCALLVAAVLTDVRGNPGSRLASIESIAEYRDWSIDRSLYRYLTVDKVIVGGEFFSSKPPVYAALGSVVYAVLSGVSGWHLVNEERRVITALRLCLQILPFFVGIVLAGRFLRRRVTNDGVWLWGLSAFSLGTFTFGYSATINNHSLASLLVLAAFAGAVSPDGRRTSVAFGVGFCAALAVSLDFGAGVFALALAAFLLLRAPGLGLVWFGLGAALPLLVHLHLTHHLTDSLLPFYGRRELYDYPGSYWLSARDFDALEEPTWLYAFHTLIGHHGLFAMTPLFLLAIPGLWTMVRHDRERAVGLLAASTVLITVFVYLLFGPRNYGGTAQGMRWFIVLTPLLWYPALRYADHRASSRRVRWALRILVIIGIVHASAALANPWSVSPWNWLCRTLGLGSVPPYDQLF